VAGHAGLFSPPSTLVAERLPGAKVCEGVSRGFAIIPLPNVLHCVAMRGIVAGAYPNPSFCLVGTARPCEACGPSILALRTAGLAPDSCLTTSCAWHVVSGFPFVRLLWCTEGLPRGSHVVIYWARSCWSMHLMTDPCCA